MSLDTYAGSLEWHKRYFSTFNPWQIWLFILSKEQREIYLVLCYWFWNNIFGTSENPWKLTTIYKTEVYDAFCLFVCLFWLTGPNHFTSVCLNFPKLKVSPFICFISARLSIIMTTTYWDYVQGICTLSFIPVLHVGLIGKNWGPY